MLHCHFVLISFWNLGKGIKSDLRFINAGNLLNRTLGLLKKNCQSTLAVDSDVAAEGNEFKAAVEKLVNTSPLSCIEIYIMPD